MARRNGDRPYWSESFQVEHNILWVCRRYRRNPPTESDIRSTNRVLNRDPEYVQGIQGLVGQGKLKPVTRPDGQTGYVLTRRGKKRLAWLNVADRVDFARMIEESNARLNPAHAMTPVNSEGVEVMRKVSQEWNRPGDLGDKWDRTARLLKALQEGNASVTAAGLFEHLTSKGWTKQQSHSSPKGLSRWLKNNGCKPDFKGRRGRGSFPDRWRLDRAIKALESKVQNGEQKNTS